MLTTKEIKIINNYYFQVDANFVICYHTSLNFALFNKIYYVPKKAKLNFLRILWMTAKLAETKA